MFKVFSNDNFNSSTLNLLHYSNNQLITEIKKKMNIIVNEMKAPHLCLWGVTLHNTFEIMDKSN